MRYMTVRDGRLYNIYMKLYKVKIQTVPEQTEEIKYKYRDGYVVRLTSIQYKSDNPSRALHITDGDGDEFYFPIYGQGNNKSNVAPEIPVWVKLPLYYYDEQGDIELILYGEVEELETQLKTTF